MEYNLSTQNRPNRSDDHLSDEASAKVESDTREYFDAAAPKRHTKPQRSEYSSSAYTDEIQSSNQKIPEHVQFQHLEEDTQKLVYGGSKISDEFTETEYYSDLNCVDKQHHTTGSGFIKVDNTTEVKSFSLTPDSAAESHASSRGNPATNEWIPETDVAVDFITGKPGRSD